MKFDDKFICFDRANKHMMDGHADRTIHCDPQKGANLFFCL